VERSLEWENVMNFIHALQELKSQGLTFSDCVSFYGEDDSNPYVLAARKRSLEGDLEVNDVSVVSNGSGPGAYVMSWIWVSDLEIDAPPKSVIYGLSDQPFTCVSCCSRTEQQGDVVDGMWIECCLGCGKKHWVSNDLDDNDIDEGGAT
jgi:hypothetical protein